MVKSLALYCSICLSVAALDNLLGVESFPWQNTGMIILEDNHVFYLGGTSIAGPELKEITTQTSLKETEGLLEFRYGEDRAIIIPGDSRNEVVQFDTAELGKLNENIYGDSDKRTETYPPGDSNIEQIITSSALSRTIRGKKFVYDSQWLLRKYYLACNCHPQTFANEVPPWIQGDNEKAVEAEVRIKFKKATAGMSILNGFVDVYFPQLYREYSRLKEIQILAQDFKQSISFSDVKRFTDIKFPKETREIRIQIQQTYKGSRFKNIAISAILGYPPLARGLSNKELIQKYRKKTL